MNKEGLCIILYDEDERIAHTAATTFVQRGVDNVFMLSGGLRVMYQKFHRSGVILGWLLFPVVVGLNRILFISISHCFGLQYPNDTIGTVPASYHSLIPHKSTHPSLRSPLRSQPVPDALIDPAADFLGALRAELEINLAQEPGL